MKREDKMENNGTKTKLNDREMMLKALRIEVQKLCPEGVKVEMQEMGKNNGVVKQGMVIEEKGNKISPVIYLEPYLMNMEEGNYSIEETANAIYEVYQKHHKKESDIATTFVDVEWVKEKIIYQLINLEKNQDLLKDRPYRIIGEDLAVVCALLLEKGSSGVMTVKINREHVKLWGMNEEELWSLAEINTPKCFPVTMKSIEEAMFDILKTQLEAQGIVFDEKVISKLFDDDQCQADTRKKQSFMYILSNQYGIWGASVILYPGVLKEAAKKLGGDLLVLPSSIHETIIVRQEDRLEYDKMAEMVKEINHKEVLPEEVLSDSVYLYHESEDSLCRVAGNGKKSAG